MTSENLKLKPSEKITIILNKYDVKKAHEILLEAADELHKRIEQEKKDKAKEIEDLNNLQATVHHL